MLAHPVATASLALLAVAQTAALVAVVVRLLPGRHRLPPVRPLPFHEPAPGGAWPGGARDAGVSVVVPARHEAARLGPSLAGLAAQGATMLEAIVVDGASTDDTAAMVRETAARDPRIRLLDEPPRPPRRVGRPWAIAAGARAARGDWVLVIDADVAPRPGMVAGVVAAARAHGYDAVSFAPRILAPGAGARWLQAAFVITLVYRFGAAGTAIRRPERALANGQCLLIDRRALEAAGGYELAASSFCDDVQIVRSLGARGARIGFLDGPALFDVLMYATARETWRAWPRSLNMRDATRPLWRWLDAAVLLLAQALPPLVLLALALRAIAHAAPLGATARAVVLVNALLMLVRLLLLAGTAGSFAARGLGFWLSPLADPAAALRVIATTFTRSREWRGAVPAPPPMARPLDAR